MTEAFPFPDRHLGSRYPLAAWFVVVVLLSGLLLPRGFYPDISEPELDWTEVLDRPVVNR